MKFYTSYLRNKNDLLVRGYDGNKQFFEKHALAPSFYIPDPLNTNPKYHSFYGKKLKKIDFENSWDAGKYRKENKDIDLHELPFFEYVKIHELFNSDHDISKVKTAIIDIETKVGKDADGNPDFYDSFPNVLNPCHEILLITTIIGSNVHVYTIDFDTINEDEIIETVRKELPPGVSIDNINFKFTYFKNDKLLLQSFIRLMQTERPDILSGWNSNGFDIPYIANRIVKLLGRSALELLSPFGVVDSRVYEKFGKEQVEYKIGGIELLDYLDLYKKFELSPRPNYKLETISQIELGAGKLDYDGTFREFYSNEYQKFVAYNIIDVILVHALDKALSFIEVALDIAYSSLCVYSDVFRVTRIWDNIIANYCRENDVLVPTDFKHEHAGYQGAFVKPTIPGKYPIIASFDIGSLYPSLIMQNNISPETLIPESQTLPLTTQDVMEKNKYYKDAIKNARELNATLSSNGSLFSKEKIGYIPTLIEIYADERFAAKRKMSAWAKLREYAKVNLRENNYSESSSGDVDFNTLDFGGVDKLDKDTLIKFIDHATITEHRFDKKQHAKKILINSLYGVLGTQYFRFFNVKCAEAITLTGQTCTAQSFDVVNTFMQDLLKTDTDYSVASDTDSVYVNLTDLISMMYNTTDVSKVLDKIVKLTDNVIGDKLTSRYNQFAEDLNSVSNRIIMNREVIGSAVFVAKKNYTIMVYDDEGLRLAEPKLKVTGLEAVKSSTPTFFQKKLMECYKLLFQSDEEVIHKKVEEIYSDTMNLPPGALAGVSTANNIEKYFTTHGFMKGTPKHIKGVLSYNRLIKGSELYQPIESGDKVSIIQLTEPNPLRSPVLAYSSNFPSDLIDESYIDKESDYEKYFVKPLNRVLDILQWNHKYEASLDDLFM